GSSAGATNQSTHRGVEMSTVSSAPSAQGTVRVRQRARDAAAVMVTSAALSVGFGGLLLALTSLAR
ncbi:MAG: hypothetical protein KDB63_19730, partial [Nocardioidaceae bacterium]|nr:hypothetical protein [Nocardioidaceae bacterium]